MDVLTPLVGRGAYLPHGDDFSWAPGLLWSMAAADGVIAAVCFAIPLAIVGFVRKRGADPVNWIAWLFSGFVFACGLTHTIGIWTLWRPDYGVEVLVKLLTAVIAVMTAVAAWRLIPAALKAPSVRRMRGAIRLLEAEVRRRKSAEEHLVAIEQNLAATLASIDAGFIATNREGRVTRMNAVAERVTGWSQGNARGRSLWRVFELDDRPPDHDTCNPVDALIEEGVAVATRRSAVANVRNGMRTPLEVKAALTRTNDGDVLGLAMVLRDTTRLDLAQGEGQRLAAIVESCDDAIVGQTLDGRITTWNHAARALFGYSADEAVGCPIEMLLPMERREQEMRMLADLARGEQVPAFDTMRQCKDGSCIDVSVTTSPIRDGTGHIVGTSMVTRDVSYQRRAESALRESETRLRFALEAAEIGDWDLEMHTGVMRRSIRHDRCFGYDALQPAWDFQTFLRHVHPDDRAEVLRSFEAAYGHLADWITECRVIWPDGSTHWIGVRASMVVESRDPARMLGIVTDITKQKLAEQARARAQQLEAENRQIQEAQRLKSQFLANMSHELRTPLNAIIGFAELLQSGAVSAESPQHHEFLGHIGSSGHHLLQTINAALDLSKVESGQFEFAVAGAGRTEAAGQRLLVIEHDGPDQARIIRTLSEAGFQVDVASTGEQALQRAVDGAYDAIALDLALPGQRGLGTLARIRHRGAGRESPVLALRMHADTGEAATFAIADVFAKPIRTHEIRAAMQGLRRPDDRPVRVMVIDDDPAALELMRATLAVMGIAAVCLPDGRRALREIEQHRPDAIILDLVMPEFDGFQVLDALRRLPGWDDTPVFVWTSMILTDEEYATLAQSARAILSKGGGALAQLLEDLRRRRAPVRVWAGEVGS